MTAEATALFLFAHQDDEFGVFHRIEECVRRGLRVHCAFFTAGSARRNEESLAVLRQLGVRPEDVAFAGDEAGIPDAGLAERLPAARAWLQRWLARFPDIDSIHVSAWEGGHQDHDALHALAVTVARDFGLLERVRQFPLYHGYGSLHAYMNALAPLDANGPVESRRIPLRARLRYLRLCASYPSQKSTWVGLLPCVALRYLLRGQQDLQRVSPARLGEPPHPGLPYYERRGFYTWNAMRTRVAELTTPKT